MKYTITINQKALVELAPSLDLVDCAILDYVYHLCASPSEAVGKQRVTNDAGTWTWVNYGHLMADMPLLRIKSGGAISKRVQALQAAGFIDSMKGKGFRLYVRMLPLIDSAFTETKASVRTGESQLSPRRKNQDTSNQDTSISPGVRAANAEVGEVIKAFEDVHPKASTWYKNTTQRKAAQGLLDAMGYAKTLAIVKAIPKLLSMPYCPKSITTPHELLENLPKLAAFTQQQRSRAAKFTVETV